MPLASIQVANGGLDKWFFDHLIDHQEIIAAIKTQTGAQLTQWPIYPFTPKSPDSWNKMHAAMHSDMNNALGLSGSDLNDIDFENIEVLNDFIGQNYIEHSNARQTLKI